MSRLLLLGAALALLGQGCKRQPAAQPVPVQPAPGPGALPGDHPPVDLPPVSRTPRRLSVDQVLAAVEVVASDDGSISWNQEKDSIKRTLGKPDFISITEEDLTPSTLYMKFMDDLARDVCNKMVYAPNQVLMKYAGPTDTLASDPAKVKQNLRYLYLRFFGRKVADSDEQTIQPLLGVFQAVSQGATYPDGGAASGVKPAVEGWRAVCIAGFTSPDFHLY